MKITTTADRSQPCVDFSAEVEAGAMLLDVLAPGWFNTLRLSQLNLACGESCVLGQLYTLRALPETLLDLADTFDEHEDNGYARMAPTLAILAPHLAPQVLALHGDILHDENYGFTIGAEQIVAVAEAHPGGPYWHLVCLYAELTRAWTDEVARRRTRVPELVAV